MQSLQAMSKTPAQSSNLPPLQNLPSWSRNSFGRRKQARPIVRDRLQPIKSIREEMDERVDDASCEKTNFSGRIVSAPSRGHGLDQEQKSDNIEKRIDFLRNQHAETLAYLHSEIERLKGENKELSFKLVMARTGVNLHKDGTSPSVEDSSLLQSVDSGEMPYEKAVDDIAAEDKTISEAEKVPVIQKKLSYHLAKESANRSMAQQAPSSSAKRNKRHGSGKSVSVKSTPTPPLSAKATNTKSRITSKPKAKHLDFQEKKQASPAASSPSSSISAASLSNKQGIPLGQSLLVVTVKDKTVQVHMPADGAPRSPTLVECKAIIKHQQETNQRQEKELSKLKSDLNEALYADKWTPDAYLLAKSYVTEELPTNTRQNTPANRSLPRLQSREQLTQSGRLAGRMHVVHDSVSLPALRPNVAPTVADRKRRQQAVVRGRGSKKDLF